MQYNLAHILDPSTGINPWWFIAGAVVVLVLVIEHHVVAGFDNDKLVRRVRTSLAALITLSLAALVAPVTGTQPAGAAQSAALPDLISDPPRPSFFNELNTPDGSKRLVVTFDGYVHNIGEGPLDVVGNPQETNGMRQRVRTGDEWEDVGAPTVRYETEDGHNHFHLIEAIEYVLWNELQGTQTAIGSKIGFCLVDSEQMEPGTDQSYSEDLDKFCEEDNPGATSLRMGISSGWRDIYDATTTLQWVDVSNVAPGRYWIGAITDPNDEIVESNEDNNDLIFSETTISVPGFSLRPQSPIEVTGAVGEFSLRSTSHGGVTQPVYVIEQGPSSGALDVPLNTDLGSPVVRYFPEPGFEGTDQIVVSVHDATSPYPFDRPTQTLTISVSADAGAAATQADNADLNPNLAPSLLAPSTFFESERDQAFSVQIDATDVNGNPARVFATGLPAGIVADADTGVISGVAVEQGIFDVELVAVGATPAEVATLAVTWIINQPESASGLTDTADQSSPRGELTRLRVGASSLDLRFEADGLPPGLALDPMSPVITGTPTEAGDYAVVIRQFDGDDVAAEITFDWTIRATIDIEFAL